jgi:transposase
LLHVGLDLSRRRLDVCLLDEAGGVLAETAVPSDADGLRGLASGLGGQQVRAVIESMNGARFVHDTLEELGWDVLVADAQKVKGLAPLACKTDKIDARVLAELSWRDLVPAIWLPAIRRERELARFRSHLVRHRTTLKNRIHATPITFGHACPGQRSVRAGGPRSARSPGDPGPVAAQRRREPRLIDDLGLQIARLTVELKRLGADHRYIPLLVTAPGFGWINAFTVASEIGDIERFPSPAKLCGYTGPCPRGEQRTRALAPERHRPASDARLDRTEQLDPQLAASPSRARRHRASSRLDPPTLRPQTAARWRPVGGPLARSPRVRGTPTRSPERPRCITTRTSPSPSPSPKRVWPTCTPARSAGAAHSVGTAAAARGPSGSPRSPAARPHALYALYAISACRPTGSTSSRTP